MYRSKITVSNLTTEDMIDTVLKLSDPNDSFIYFDPPYYNKGKDLYTNYYNSKDHQHLKNLIISIDHIPWLLTYDNCPEIEELYEPYNLDVFSLNYSAGDKKIGQEISVLSKAFINRII